MNRAWRAWQCLDGLRRGLLGLWVLVHASEISRAEGGWHALAFLFMAWALYDYGRERGEARFFDELLGADR